MNKRLIVSFIIGLLAVVVIGIIAEVVVFRVSKPEAFSVCKSDIELAVELNRSGEDVYPWVDSLNIEDSCRQLHETLDILTAHETLDILTAPAESEEEPNEDRMHE